MSRLEKTNRFWVLMWGIFFATLAGLLVFVIFSQNETKSGENPEMTSVQSMACESDSIFYPFFTFDESSRKDLKIMVTFDNENFRTISLRQTLYYDDEDLVSQSEGHNHAAMNISFGENGLEADVLDANYATLEEGMRFSLYGVFNKMRPAEMQYFLLDGMKDYDYKTIRAKYEGMGFACKEDNL